MDTTTPKNIAIVSVGSRGDVQPYCILGAALSAQGHNVWIAAETRLQSLVANEFKLPYRPLVGDLCGWLFDEAYQRRFRTARFLDCFDLINEWYETFNPRDILASFVPALSGADIVIGGSFCTTESYSVAQAMGATWIPVFLGHIHLPTTEFPQWLLEEYTGSWFGWVNKMTHACVWHQAWNKQHVHVNEWRQTQLHLPPLRSSYGLLDNVRSHDHITLHHACSLLLAGPKRRVPLDYRPGKVVYSGFLFPTTALPEPEALKAFLNKSDSPVIYMGFGSMASLEPLALVQLAIDICKLAECRCVLATGWSSAVSQEGCQELVAANADVMYVEGGSVSHMWLFPQMSCVIHHAGLGTLATGLRCGVPQLPCPKFVDQFHNAKVLVDLGVALSSVKPTQMSSAVVGALVQRVLCNDNNIQGAAHSMSEYVTRESEVALPHLCSRILNTPPTFPKMVPDRA